MTDPLKSVETTVANAASAQVAKQESWIKANAKPLIIGVIAGALLIICIVGIVHTL